MDIGISNIVPIIASSTTDYLVIFSPVFLLIGGLLLALGVMFFLINVITGRNNPIDVPEFDFDLADDLEDFYSKKGRSPRAEYDYENVDPSLYKD